MPNGTPINTGFKQKYLVCDFIINDTYKSSPVQTVSATTDWLSIDYDNLGQQGLSADQGAAIKADGTLWTWGGYLGNNSSIFRSQPGQTVSQTTNWKQLSVGSYFMGAVKTDGTLWLWGCNKCAKLGDNTIIDRSSPVQTVTSGSNWRQVSLGEDHAAGIKTDGTLWLWGYTGSGRIGNSNSNRCSPIQTISQGTNWKIVSLGKRHSTAIKSDGTLWLWGSNSEGQLGDSSTTNRNSPVQTISQGTNWKQVSSGKSHTAAIKSDGTLWLWGCNNNGELGNNNKTNRSSPVQTISTGTNWVFVSVGSAKFDSDGPGQHTAALKTDGTLWLWGINCSGVLGINLGITHRSSPVQTVSTGTNWKQVSAGFDNIIAQKTDGTLWTWGQNCSGALGNYSNLDASCPVQTSSVTRTWNEDCAWCSFDSEPFIKVAIKTDGTLWCWGNIYSSPVQTISSGTNWKQVSIGCSQAAAIKTDGTLWLWGSLDPEIGILNGSSPTQHFTASTEWKQVSIGQNTIGAVKTDGTLWLWGSGSAGKFGNNSTIDRSSPVQTVSSGTNWKQVAVNCDFAGAIKTDGTLWMWGFGLGGSLGNNSIISHSSPVQTVSTGTNWKQMTSKCGTTWAIKTDGTLWAWGFNAGGQLGNNSTISRSSPVQTVSTGTNWRQVGSDGNVASAVKTDGTLWVWGYGSGGAIGNNCAIDRSSPTQTLSNTTCWKQAVGTMALNNSNEMYFWGAVRLGYTRTPTCVVTDVGNILVEKEYLLDVYPNLVPWMKSPGLWNVGLNAEGSLGNNDIISRSSPVQTISSGTNWKQLSISTHANVASTSHLAAIKTDGTLWLWGQGETGKLGNNNTINHSSPVQTVSTGTNWKEVSLGSSQSAAIKTDGTLWLWGQGAGGQLGNNNTINQSSPVQTVSTGTNWKQVSSGYDHTASIKTDGTLWMWGVSAYGQLGNNNTINQSSPVQTVSTGTNWKQVSNSRCHISAIKTDGTLWLWGNDANGRLGDNSTISRSSPVQTVSTGTNWKQVSVGQLFTSAIKTDGTLWLWGDGAAGKLGNYSNIDHSSPVQTVTTTTDWKNVSSRFEHVAAIKTDGTLWLWGCNVRGQLGINTFIDVSSPVQTIMCGNYWKNAETGKHISSFIKEESDW